MEKYYGKMQKENPPRPQTVRFYLSKTLVFETPSCLIKVTKICLKMTSNGPHMEQRGVHVTEIVANVT